MAVPSFAQISIDLPKVAVYLASGGEERQAGELLRTAVLEGLVNSRRYSAIELSEDFLKQLQNERHVNEAQVSRLGRQAGVSFVCVVSASLWIDDYQLSAKMIDVETAKVVNIGVTYSTLSSMDSMTKAANEIVGKILGDASWATGSGSSGSRQQVTGSVAPQQTFIEELEKENQYQAASGAKVFINTYPPDAGIYIGGKCVGMSNSNDMIDVPVGTHLVMFEKDGAVRKTETMTFEPGINYTKTVILNPESPASSPASTSVAGAYNNFTDGQRIGAFLLNFFTIPGLGSAAVMKDAGGFFGTWGLVGSGIGIAFVGAGSNNTGAVVFGALIIGAGEIFNVVRPWTYKRSASKMASDSIQHDGLRFSVIPDRNGDYKTMIAYGLSF
jgi:hypothetical protein